MTLRQGFLNNLTSYEESDFEYDDLLLEMESDLELDQMSLSKYSNQ